MTSLEKTYYTANPPEVGGRLAGGVPRVGPTRSASAPTRPPTYLPAPDTTPSHARPALSGEGGWQSLVRPHGRPAIEAFMMKDANGGYWQNGRSVVALRRGAASLVFHQDGHLDVVRGGSAAPGRDVVAVRQNLDLLVDHGVANPDVDTTSKPTWGFTIGNTTYVRRSAVGVRADGSVVCLAGAAMSVRTLANIVHDAGAVRAMELDISPDWTNFITNTHPSKGKAVPHMLTKDEKPNPYRYLQPSSRDFVAVLAR